MDLSPEEYQQYVKEKQKKSPLVKNLLFAFVIGGAICVVGQFIREAWIAGGLSEEDAGTATSISLILLSALLTGLNLYNKLARSGGAGTLVPITGFANSVASPAIEYKKEGQVFGVGCKIFTIAGPVILFGTLTSWVLGVVVWLLQLSGIL